LIDIKKHFASYQGGNAKLSLPFDCHKDYSTFLIIGSLGIGVVAPIYGGVKWQEKRSKKIP